MSPMAPSPKNPPWSREELILALNLYFQKPPVNSANDPRAIQLSKNLTALPYLESVTDRERFRNANGVNMKLANFRRFDPSYTGKGKVGLRGGGKLEAEIWSEFSGDIPKLQREAERILNDRRKHHTQTWIFQGNPTKFEIDRYLANHGESDAEIRWQVNQHSSSIQIGDVVYLWRSKRNPVDNEFGILARCVCVSTAQDMPEDAPDLWLKSLSGEVSRRVRMKVEDYRPSEIDGMITAHEFKSDPILMNARILKLRTETNYLLDDQEAVALKRLWEDSGPGLDEPDIEFPEGRKIVWRHVRRERNRRLVGEVKRAFLKAHDRLFCEACGMEFETAYGREFIDCFEVHHGVPLANLEPGQATKLADMHVLCPNCHTVIHKSKPWLTVLELKAILAGTG